MSNSDTIVKIHKPLRIRFCALFVVGAICIISQLLTGFIDTYPNVFFGTFFIALVAPMLTLTFAKCPTCKRKTKKVPDVRTHMFHCEKCNINWDSLIGRKNH